MIRSAARRAAVVATVAALAFAGCSDDSGRSIEPEADVEQRDGPPIDR